MTHLDVLHLNSHLAIHSEERAAKQRQHKDTARAQAELDDDRRKLQAEKRDAVRLMRLIVQVEQRARWALIDRCNGPNALTAIARIFAAPGIRTARGFEGQEPIQRTTRPKGRDGAVSFHFSVESLAKGGELADVLAGRTSIRRVLSNSWSHQRYIEREGAAEHVTAAKLQNYIENSDKMERRNDCETSATVASFGTIGATRDERIQFWRVVEEVEETPSPPQVTIDPTVRPEIWAKVRLAAAGMKPLPEILSEALSASAPVVGTVSTRDATRLIDIFRNAGFSEIDRRPAKGGFPPPIRFKLGKGGRVQTRIIVELPCEMTPQQRLDLAEAFCADFRTLSLPFWAVIHQPTKHNDDRNFHLHVNLYDRPARMISHPQTGLAVWDFELVEEYTDRHRHRRTRRPYMKNKPGAMRSRLWVKRERQRFADLANQHLAAGGHAKRFDARTYVEMGVQQKARARIPKAAFAKERNGEETAEGAVLAAQELRTALEAELRAVRRSASKEREFCEEIRRSVLPQRGRHTTEAQTAVERARKIALHCVDKLDSLFEHSALSFVASKLESRARLKPKKKRVEADNAALVVAKQLRREADREMQLAEGSAGHIATHLAKLQHAKRVDDVAIALAAHVTVSKNAARRPGSFIGNSANDAARPVDRVLAPPSFRPPQTCATPMGANATTATTVSISVSLPTEKARQQAACAPRLVAAANEKAATAAQSSMQPALASPAAVEHQIVKQPSAPNLMGSVPVNNARKYGEAVGGLRAEPKELDEAEKARSRVREGAGQDAKPLSSFVRPASSERLQREPPAASVPTEANAGYTTVRDPVAAVAGEQGSAKPAAETSSHSTGQKSAHSKSSQLPEASRDGHDLARGMEALRNAKPPAVGLSRSLSRALETARIMDAKSIEPSASISGMFPATQSSAAGLTAGSLKREFLSDASLMPPAISIAEGAPIRRPSPAGGRRGTAIDTQPDAARDSEASKALVRGLEAARRAALNPASTQSPAISRRLEEIRQIKPLNDPDRAAVVGHGLEELKDASVISLNRFLRERSSIRDHFANGSVRIPSSITDLQHGQAIGDLLRLTLTPADMDRLTDTARRLELSNCSPPNAFLAPEQLAKLIRGTSNLNALERVDRMIFMALTRICKLEYGYAIPMPPWPPAVKQRTAGTQVRQQKRDRGGIEL